MVSTTMSREIKVIFLIHKEGKTYANNRDALSYLRILTNKAKLIKESINQYAIRTHQLP